MSFLSALSRGGLLMDGAMGSQLRGMGFLHPERACLTHANRVATLHAAFARAGSRVLLTNTFQLNPPALALQGLAPHLETMGRKALSLAREAGPDAWVLGDVGPIYTPGSTEEFRDREALRRTLAALEGADGILFETCSSPAALAAVEYALHRVPEVDGLPLLLSLCYLRNAAGELVTLSGHPPESYARHAARHGVAALGVNCGKEIDCADVAQILRRYRDCTDLPLFARPNAGTPNAEGAYPRSAVQMATSIPTFVEAGAGMIGGCCGTTAEHIARFNNVLVHQPRSPGDP